MSEIIIDQFHYHEVLDRLNIVNAMIGDFILDHPLLDQEPAVRHLVEAGADHFERAYQLAGKLSYQKSPDAKE